MERDREIKQKGKVWLAGAGPGSGDLLTVKTKRLLQEADCIVCDRLVGKEVLSMIPPEKEVIDVGKFAGHHAVSQEEINGILVREAKRGKKVLRLKGGDPFLFGRGGEEAEALRQEKIPFEVVPGISSALAVPAYCGIPVTHRDYVSSVHLITGHHKEGRDREIPYKALVEAGGTLVFLMGVGSLEKILNGLRLAGMKDTVPAAVLQQGTTAGQRTVTATVGTLAQKARNEQVKAPSIIVVGEVCGREKDLKWYEDLPLFGEKILVTRPSERGDKLQEQLKALGAEVLSVPIIQTVPIGENGSEDEYVLTGEKAAAEHHLRLQAIKTEIERLERYQVLVFTSPYGVERFFALLFDEGKDVRAVSHMKFAVIGQGTADALREKGIRADYMPKQYDSVSLGRLLARDLEDGTRVLLARSSIGSEEVIQELQKNPSLVYKDLAIYDTRCRIEYANTLRSLMEDGTVSSIVFTSSSGVEGFCRMLGNFPYETVNAVCIGKKTEQSAKTAGMRTITAENATIEDLTACFRILGKNRGT